MYARERDHLTHFLTYADNNAVGYFAKQGFTKEITLDRDRVCFFSLQSLQSSVSLSICYSNAGAGLLMPTAMVPGSRAHLCMRRRLEASAAAAC